MHVSLFQVATVTECENHPPIQEIRAVTPPSRLDPSDSEDDEAPANDDDDDLTKESVQSCSEISQDDVYADSLRKGFVLDSEQITLNKFLLNENKVNT